MSVSFYKMYHYDNFVSISCITQIHHYFFAMHSLSMDTHCLMIFELVLTIDGIIILMHS